MSFKSGKFGDTTIIDSPFNHLSISWDFDDEGRNPVLLFTPNINELHHSHIDLSLDEAKKLHDWLASYIEDEEGKRK